MCVSGMGRSADGGAVEAIHTKFERLGGPIAVLVDVSVAEEEETFAAFRRLLAGAEAVDVS